MVTYKDRLLRFGAEILNYICKLKNIEFIALHQQQNEDSYQTLAEDVLAILTVFASRIYGKRSHEKRQKNKKQEKK